MNDGFSKWLAAGFGPHLPTIHIQHDSIWGWSLWSENGRQVKRWEALAMAALLLLVVVR